MKEIFYMNFCYSVIETNSDKCGCYILVIATN
jgi:hypothetical protein